MITVEDRLHISDQNSVESLFSHQLNCKMSKATKKKSSKKRAGSEATAFDQKTIQEFKEAFGIMDQNKDGVICKNDLKDLYASMGQIASEKQIEDMIKEAPGPINFTVFLTLFGERLTGTDPEQTIVGAFAMFDKKESGKITEEELVKILKNKRGEPLDEDEIKAMYKGNPPIEGGMVDYKAFAHLITTGAQDELASA
ncbi:AT09395p [Strongyloides ratti]|uniref:AT09395p n=1 Tax=Strongyloides ratti TaxID=34506 RepID=A0A090LRS5_STRRB|nr:AT09395p [Strongyloides ratti]CEF70897.1 AT09395p [Strongyloides ratti]